MRIALFATCIADSMFPQAPQATVAILERLGHEVIFPESQVCCGQMHANTGYFTQASSLIRNHVRTFEPVLDGDSALARRSKEVAARTYELSELLIDVLGVTDVGASFPHRVTYHPTCHSMRIAKVGDRPLRLLEAVDGIDLVPLPDAEVCCGFGGTFSMKNYETSTAMLADKVSNVMSTRAEVLCMGDYSCLMHVGGGLSRLNSGVRIMHLAEILASTKDRPFNGNVSFAPAARDVKKEAALR